MTVLGLMGFTESGKDTVAGILEKDFGYERYAFADALKEQLRELDPIIYTKETHDPETGHAEGEEEYSLSYVVGRDGWDGAKRQYPEVRRLLQTYGQQFRDHVSPNYWVNRLADKLERSPIGLIDRKIVISDVRHENEAKFVRTRSGLMALVDREGHGAINNHPSEAPIWRSGYVLAKPDYLIKNWGELEDLEAVVWKMAEHLS